MHSYTFAHKCALVSGPDKDDPKGLWESLEQGAKALRDMPGEVKDALKQLWNDPKARFGLGVITTGIGIATGNPAMAAAGGNQIYSSITGESLPPDADAIVKQLASGDIDWSELTTSAQKVAIAKAFAKFPEVAVAIGEIVNRADAQIQLLKAQGAAAMLAAKKARAQAKEAIHIAELAIEKNKGRTNLF
jgi:hypothetical protein